MSPVRVSWVSCSKQSSAVRRAAVAAAPGAVSEALAMDWAALAGANAPQVFDTCEHGGRAGLMSSGLPWCPDCRRRAPPRGPHSGAHPTSGRGRQSHWAGLAPSDSLTSVSRAADPRSVRLRLLEAGNVVLRAVAVVGSASAAIGAVDAWLVEGRARAIRRVPRSCNRREGLTGLAGLAGGGRRMRVCSGSRTADSDTQHAGERSGCGHGAEADKTLHTGSFLNTNGPPRTGLRVHHAAEA